MIILIAIYVAQQGDGLANRICRGVHEETERLDDQGI